MEIDKFNPFHDARGRFSTANGGVSFTFRTRDPNKQHWADMAAAREAERTKDWPDSKKKPEMSVKQGLATGLGEQHAAAMEKLVSAAPKEIQDIWNKYGGEIQVGETNAKHACFKPATGKIYVNIDKDSSSDKANGTPPYETTMHESGHSIDHSIGKALGIGPKKFSVSYNDGEFEKSLIKEADDYIKSYQKKLSQETGQKVSISQARAALGKQMIKEGYAATGDVSDMLEGATKGKFSGSAGHGKTYWTGSTVFGIKMPGHSVATEAFAEMFSATTTNPTSLAKIKEVFPKSYDVFMRMIKEAAQ